MSREPSQRALDAHRRIRDMVPERNEDIPEELTFPLVPDGTSGEAEPLPHLDGSGGLHEAAVYSAAYLEVARRLAEEGRTDMSGVASGTALRLLADIFGVGDAKPPSDADAVLDWGRWHPLALLSEEAKAVGLSETEKFDIGLRTSVAAFSLRRWPSRYLEAILGELDGSEDEAGAGI